MTAVGAGMVLRPGALVAQAAPPAQTDPSVKRVLVMFKCHFDAGFIDTQYNVVHKYFTSISRRRLRLRARRTPDGKRRYVWTTGSWLVFEYLEQASRRHSARRWKKRLGAATLRGMRCPSTWQTEMLAPSMIEGSLALSQSLDRRFGTVTTGAKMTDVPGHTRGIIAPLAKHGVTFLEIGVNGGSTPAELPPMFSVEGSLRARAWR